ncbi:MAG: prepilin-type N-terminal cleavage/methylation domain-containing protein [Desulfocucumaceae bacterium]
MDNKVLIPPPKSGSRSFTLIEIIIVIIIVGILAALGISQYSSITERGRGVEAKMILGQIRMLAYEYRLENGTITGMTYSNVNIGSSSDQIPYPCRSTHYFAYDFWGHPASATDPILHACASRCGVNGWGQGKPPQGTVSPLQGLCLQADFSTGTDTWESYGVRY